MYVRRAVRHCGIGNGSFPSQSWVSYGDVRRGLKKSDIPENFNEPWLLDIYSTRPQPGSRARCLGHSVASRAVIWVALQDRIETVKSSADVAEARAVKYHDNRGTQYLGQ